MSDIIIPGLKPEDAVLLENARNYAYFCSMVEQIRKGECPFCELDTRLNHVIMATRHWRAWDCPTQFRAPHLETHIVLAPKQHLTHPRELMSEEWEELTTLLGTLTDNLLGGAFMMRFGDPAKSAASVRHLHGNIQVPDGTGEVRLTIAKDPESVVQKRRAIEIFSRLLEHHVRPGDGMRAYCILSRDEYDLVADRL